MYKSIIIGHIGQDAVYRDFNGSRFISFSVAHSERYKDADGETIERTTWFSCLKKGEGRIIEYLKKGTLVYLEGNPSHRIYLQSGKPRIGNNINVTHVELLTTKRNPDAGQEGSTPADPPQSLPPEPETDDLPF